jgi:hypothetical protein
MRKAKRIVFVGVLTLVLLFAGAAHAQTPEEPSGPDVDTLWGDFADFRFWVLLLVTLIAGGVGGVAYELLILQGNLELPHRATPEEVKEAYPYAVVKNLVDLGVWARVVIGALAAVAALLVLAPDSMFGILSTAVIAGSAGTAVFRSLQERLSAALALKEAADTREIALRQNAKVEEVQEALAIHRKMLEDRAGMPVSDSGLELEAMEALSGDREMLDDIDRMLNEARGIGQAIKYD